MTSPSQNKEPSASQALVRAASSGDLPAVQNLLAAGADVNWPNEGGQTALILAAVMGHAEVVMHLVEAGADPNLRDHLGLTAMEWSTRRGFPEIAQLLTKISPPPSPLRSERTTESHKTDSTKQSAEPTTRDPEPTITDALSKAEALTVNNENETAGDIQARKAQPELVETPTDEHDVAGKLQAGESQLELAETPTDEHVVAGGLQAGESQPELAETPTDEHVVAGELQAGEAQLELVETPTDEHVVTGELQAGEAQPELAETPTDEHVVAGELRAGKVQPELVETPTDEHVVAGELQAGEIQSELVETPTDENVVEPAAVATSAAPPLTAAEDQADLVASEFESQPAPAEIATSEPITEPAHEIGEPVAAALSTPRLDDLEPVSAAGFAAEHFLLHEDDETLPQPGVAAEAPEITFPKRQSRPAVTDAGEAPAPAIQVPVPGKRAHALSGSALGLSDPPAVKVEADSASLKRCPRCGAVYRNSPLSFCTRDNATLIDVDRLHPISAPAQSSSFPVAVWLLIAFVLGASGFAAYRLTESFFRKPAPTTAALVKPIEPVPEVKKPAFSVGGDLTGMELKIPEPEYPSELSGAGITGPITVRVRVNKNGRVISAAATTGDTRLRSAALKAARLATFAPDKLAEISPRGRAVSGSITYEFAAPQTSTATSPATTSPASTATPETSGVQTSPAAPNADPNAPVVSNELNSAATNVPAPDYPTRARSAGIGGTITVTIRVNRTGRVISWRTSAGDSQLRAAAIRAARKATFSRDKLPGSGDVLGTITYNFTP